MAVGSSEFWKNAPRIRKSSNRYGNLGCKSRPGNYKNVHLEFMRAKWGETV